MLILALGAVPCSAADRVDVDLEIWLPTRADPGPWGWSDQPARMYQSRGLAGHPADLDGAEVDDGKLSISCNLRDGSLEVAVTYVPARYPEHLPEELLCPVGPYDAHVRVVPRAPLYTDPAQLNADETGVEVRRYAIQRRSSSSGALLFALPPAVAWTTQQVEARRHGRRWADTTCAVAAGERPTLTVSFSEAARDGEGSCALADAEGGVHVVPVRIVSVPTGS